MKHAQYASDPRRRFSETLRRSTICCVTWLIAIVTLPAMSAVDSVPAEEVSTQQTATSKASAADEPIQAPEAVGAPTTLPASSGVLLNFKDASLQTVLEYLSEAAGLVILNGARLEGRVTVMSRQPVSTDEVIRLLDTILKDKGYAAIRTNRTLKIVPVEEAVRENLPVYSGNDPSEVPVADRLVTQVIPIRHADAVKLRTDLAPIIGTTATLTANKDSNSLILVDTQARIRRIMQIICALDEHMAGVAEVRIYQLKYADATTTSRLIIELFKQDTSQSQAQSVFFRLARLRRGGRGGRGDQDSQQGGPQQRVVAAADDRTNTLVVSAPPDMLKVIDGIVKELDSDPTEEQSVFVYPLKNAQAANLQAVLNQIFAESTTAAGRTTATRTGGARTMGRRSRTLGPGAAQIRAGVAGDLAGQVYVVADEDTNSLLVRTPAKHVERVKEILGQLDRPIRQVLIKVLIAEVTHDDMFDLGTEFSVLNLQFGTAGSFTAGSDTVRRVLDQATTPDQAGGGLVTTTVDAGLSATFNALQRDGRLDVLSRPYVLTSDNKEAIITVGQEVPFVRQSRTTETGQTINTIVYEDVGIILKVTPHVNPEGLVIMSVNHEISSISDTTVTISDNVQAQVYNKRSGQTQVAVLDGQTIVIGGLMEDRITDVVQKVPWLGDIPGVGWLLFRRTAKRKVKTELLVFLTPRVADSPGKLQHISKDETADIKAVRGAGGPGAFEEHMKAMRRGATTRPAGDNHETQP